ncbi:hypothetical protein FOA52_013706 [Chlamydomonas sp. UWO 241]|nr:hypothetical protein FOA52_013706 [Chlamydomonas sp. UWO 241]
MLATSSRVASALHRPRVLCGIAPRRMAVCASAAASVSKVAPLAPLDDTFEATHTFTEFANWVVPGAIMQGQYPFIAPKLCETRQKGEERIAIILEAGIDTFVSLNNELPPQPEMTLAGKDGYIGYKATAELIQAAMNGPPPMELVEGKGLRTPQMDAFLPPKRKNALQLQYKPKMPHFVYGPIEDGGVPSQDALAKLLDDLKARLAAGEVLYVHCAGGKGRSGTVTSALLAAVYGISADEALTRVRRAFDTRTNDGNVNTGPLKEDGQTKFVREFVAARLKK